jgi:4'-phosphopantetheinyl transferase
MPLLKEWNIGTHGLAAIWKIEEEESFFNEHTGLYPDINNDKRRIEHLASRYLLKHLEVDFPLHQIVRDVHNKPRLDNGSFFFSVSHSWPYIAAVIDPVSETGIDIQTWNKRIGDIRQKYLSLREQLFFEDNPQLLTLAWCAKESVYKWHGKKGIGFIRHMPIRTFNNSEGLYEFTIELLAVAEPLHISLNGFTETDFACVYVV